MNKPTVLAGLILMLWGLLYRKGMMKLISRSEKNDRRISLEGLIKNTVEKEERLWLEAEIQSEKGTEVVWVPYAEENASDLVGKLVWLLIDPDNAEKSDIDWSKEMLASQKQAVRKGITVPAGIIVLVGLLLVLRGMKVI